MLLKSPASVAPSFSAIVVVHEIRYYYSPAHCDLLLIRYFR